jgi:glyceraldehyde 3-phosphate dehydrogenase
VYAERDASNIPWVKNDGVEFVLECTGFYTSAEKSQAHLDAGAKKVLISAPAKDETTPTIVYGVNHEILKSSDNIVSAGSCTTNSLAAMVKLLDDKFGVKVGFMTTIHAYTATQVLQDGPRGKNVRANRAAAANTIEHSTGAAKAIGKVVPSVNGKLQGHAQRVAVIDGSVTELTSVLEKTVTVDEINDAFKAAYSDTDYFGYNPDGIVTSDIIDDTHGGVFDPTQTDVNTVGDTQLVRTVSFYDNENGFTCNMIRTLLYFAELSK